MRTKTNESIVNFCYDGRNVPEGKARGEQSDEFLIGNLRVTMNGPDGIELPPGGLVCSGKNSLKIAPQASY